MKAQTVKHGHRVVIEWVDSCAGFGWLESKSEKSLGKIVSIGIGLESNKNSVSLTSSIDKNSGNVHGHLTIPWCAITKFKQYEKVV